MHWNVFTDLNLLNNEFVSSVKSEILYQHVRNVSLTGTDFSDIYDVIPFEMLVDDIQDNYYSNTKPVKQ